jgi:hypothetical protein
MSPGRKFERKLQRSGLCVISNSVVVCLLELRPKVLHVNISRNIKYLSTRNNSSTMFHEGDLQSGIALAVRELKLVICFVRGSFAGINTLLPELTVMCTTS